MHTAQEEELTLDVEKGKTKGYGIILKRYLKIILRYLANTPRYLSSSQARSLVILKVN